VEAGERCSGTTGRQTLQRRPLLLLLAALNTLLLTLCSRHPRYWQGL
jgi:hypothetical protein